MIVVSNDEYNRKSPDIVVVALTSNPAITDYSFRIASADLVLGTLNRPGTVRVDKEYTLAQSIVAKTFGRVAESVLDPIRQMLQELVAPRP